MSESVLRGCDRRLEKLPRTNWEAVLAQVPAEMREVLAFMSDRHCAIRYFVVQEILRTDRPVPSRRIEEQFALSADEVERILTDLERNLFFLYRDAAGAVEWAYPVTAAATPHRLKFSTGEEANAAWAVDAIAAPFVEGTLFDNDFEVRIESCCGHCQQPIVLQTHRGLTRWETPEGSSPLVFSPDVDWKRFRKPNIIDDFWRRSQFFWSEEHAAEFQASGRAVNGLYLSLEQASYSTRIVQGGLFAFDRKAGW